MKCPNANDEQCKFPACGCHNPATCSSAPVVTEQTKAQRLAGQLESVHRGKWCNDLEMESAAELRRLDAENAAQRDEIKRLRADRRALEAALFEVRDLMRRRPALNQEMAVQYLLWTNEVYKLSAMNAEDAAMKGTK